MDGRDKDVRGALATLLEPEPPMRTSVADDVRRGRALRARRRRWLAGGVAAAVVVGLGAGLGVPRLVGGTDLQPAPAATGGVTDAVQGAVERSEKALRDLGFEPTLAAPAKQVGDRIRWSFTFPSPEGYVPTRLTVVPLQGRVGSPLAVCAAVSPDCTAISHDGSDEASSYVQRSGIDGGDVRLRRWYGDGGAVELTVAQAYPLATSGGMETLPLLVVPPMLTADVLTAVADAIGNPSGLLTEPTPEPTESADRISVQRGPSKLVGYWTVAGTGTEDDGATLQLGAMEAGAWTLWRECGGMDGSWRASSAGGFIAGSYSGNSDCWPDEQGWRPTPTWLEPVRGYRLTETGAELLNASGAVMARLSPGARPDHGPHRSEITTELPELTSDVLAELDGVRVPTGATPASADAVAGRWAPVGATNNRAYLGLQANGWYEGSDGCNDQGGRWTIDRDGRLLATGGPQTHVGCDSTNVSHALTSSIVLEVDGDTLAAVDADGAVVMTFTRA